MQTVGTENNWARTDAAHALEQSVAFRNALSNAHKMKTPWPGQQHNNLAATMQAVGEHEEDIGALEACISAYDGL